MDKLKPCPFCGDTAFTIDETEDGAVTPWWSVMCNGEDCIARHRYPTEEEAIKAWNERKIQDEMLEALIKHYMTLPSVYYETKYEKDLKRLIEKATGLKIEEAIGE